MSTSSDKFVIFLTQRLNRFHEMKEKVTAAEYNEVATALFNAVKFLELKQTMIATQDERRKAEYGLI